MPKRDSSLPGEIVYVPGSWQVELAAFLRELTLLAKAAREALEADRARGGR